jgi:hypothetical protein
MKDLKKKDVMKEIDRLVYEKDPVLHKEAIQTLLRPRSLEDDFLNLAQDKEELEKFFHLCEFAGRASDDSEEGADLREFGKKVGNAYKKKNYDELCRLLLAMALAQLSDFIDLDENKYPEIFGPTVFFEKGLVPEPIIPEFFLLTTIAGLEGFDWKRGEKIATQNLVCFVVCFAEILQYFHDEEDAIEDEDQENADFIKIPASQKIGRNDSCLCGSGKKFKKCCGK